MAHMANTIPCPNPVCTHEFKQAELQNAAQLLCPKCGFRMQGQKSASAKPAPAQTKPPVAQPVQPAPPAKVVVASPAPITPIAAPVASSLPPTSPNVAAGAPPVDASANGEASVDGMFFNPGVAGDSATLIRTGKAKGKFSWLRLLLLLFAVGFAACIVIVAFGLIYLLLTRSGALRGPGDDPDGIVHIGSIRDAKGASEKVYKFVLPRNEWLVDNESQSRLGAHAAFKHSERDCWFALVVKDYGMNRPRDAEMLRFALDKLELHFADALELSKVAEPAKVGTAALKLDAQKIQFKGQVKAATWLGECFMFFHNGVGYWLFIASPDWDDVSERFGPNLLEKHLTVLSERRGWREQPPPTDTFASANGKVSITTRKDAWKAHDPKDEHENGELFLFGRYKENDNRKNAWLLVFTLPKQPDLNAAVKAAREHLDEKLKKENEEYRLASAELGATPGESATVDVGDRRGRIIDLKRTLNDEVQRYYLVAVISDPDACYVIRGECGWDSRQIWRQEFLDALRSMRIKKAE
jgi:hypothetical protein